MIFLKKHRRSGFKTSPQAQFLCWTEGFNTRNIKYIPVFESLGPAFLSRWVLRGTLNLIEGFETTSNQLSACMITTTMLETCIVGAWRSLEARLLWEQEVGGSNPLAPTNI
jgi:hypothetical protein